jgi:hypothetical protein
MGWSLSINLEGGFFYLIHLIWAFDFMGPSAIAVATIRSSLFARPCGLTASAQAHAPLLLIACPKISQLLILLF